MKRLISTLSFIFAIGLAATMAQCCKDHSPACKRTHHEATAQQSAGVNAYYFHATRRCATCQAVESVTKGALEEYYGDKVPFHSVNREKERNNPMIEKYKISGQTLLIIKGDKVINLTTDAFMNARKNPKKYKAKLKSTIDPLI